jgi:hypothetical protein
MGELNMHPNFELSMLSLLALLETQVLFQLDSILPPPSSLRIRRHVARYTYPVLN